MMRVNSIRLERSTAAQADWCPAFERGFSSASEGYKQEEYQQAGNILTAARKWGINRSSFSQRIRKRVVPYDCQTLGALQSPD